MDTARQLRDAIRHLIVTHGGLDGDRRPCGAPLTVPHAYALLELLQHRGCLTVSDLAAKLSIDRTNVSRLTARMDKDGELIREPHPEDARAHILRLTDAGLALARSVDRSSAKYSRELMAHLGGDAERFVQTLNALQSAMVSTQRQRTDKEHRDD